LHHDDRPPACAVRWVPHAIVTGKHIVHMGIQYNPSSMLVRIRQSEEATPYFQRGRRLPWFTLDACLADIGYSLHFRIGGLKDREGEGDIGDQGV
jgi:hypothetical protein